MQKIGSVFIPIQKKKSVFVEKEKHDLLFHCFQFMFGCFQEKGKGEKKKKRQGNKQVQIKLRVGAQIDEEIRYGINRELTIEIFSHQRNQ